MSERTKRRKTGGRQPGSVNRATLVGRNVSDIFKNMLGIDDLLGVDDKAVEATGRINGKGYGFRIRWKEILDGKRTPDPAYTNAVKLSLSYAVGLPGKMKDETKQKESLIFLTTNGLYPWDDRCDNMKPQTDAMLEGKAEEERVRALEAAKTIDAKADAGDTEVPETLELVQETPQDFGGRR